MMEDTPDLNSRESSTVSGERLESELHLIRQVHDIIGILERLAASSEENTPSSSSTGVSPTKPATSSSLHPSSSSPPSVALSSSASVPALVHPSLSALPARVQLYKAFLQEMQQQMSSLPGVSASSSSVSSGRTSPTLITPSIAPVADNRKRVKLNVGGKIFVTTITTLTQERSMLQAMFGGHFKMTTDENGEYFIDRDPKHFGAILNYLRSGRLVTEGLSPTELEELKNEILFYQLESVLENVKEFSDMYNRNPLTSWSQKYKSRYIEVGGDDNRSAWPIGGTYNVVTVDGWVTAGSYEWYVRIDRWDYMGIGLVSPSLLNYEQEFHKLYGCCVLYHGREFYYNFPESVQSEIRTAFKGGDIIRIRVNLEEGWVKFHVNAEEEPRCECRFKKEENGQLHRYKVKLGCLLKGNAQVTILPSLSALSVGTPAHMPPANVPLSFSSGSASHIQGETKK